MYKNYIFVKGHIQMKNETLKKQFEEAVKEKKLVSYAPPALAVDKDGNSIILDGTEKQRQNKMGEEK